MITIIYDKGTDSIKHAGVMEVPGEYMNAVMDAEEGCNLRMYRCIESNNYWLWLKNIGFVRILSINEIPAQVQLAAMIGG